MAPALSRSGTCRNLLLSWCRPGRTRLGSPLKAGRPQGVPRPRLGQRDLGGGERARRRLGVQPLHLHPCSGPNDGARVPIATWSQACLCLLDSPLLDLAPFFTSSRIDVNSVEEVL